MIPLYVDYATPSVLDSDRDRALVGLSANARRPVRFHGRLVKDIFLFRILLRALGETIWSDDSWLPGEVFLDPVITVHPDRIFFEAFSLDQSAYALVIVNPEIFELKGKLGTGTTNVDFTAWLWAALGELRSARETWLRVEPQGFEIRTHRAGGRYEKKVDLPLPWVRGFLNLQAAMAWPGVKLSARPVDLLAAIRFLRYTKAKVSPRALRYEFEPDQEPRLVLEPWEKIMPLKGAEHNYAEKRIIRTWGRRRLKLIEPLLPFADRVDIYLKGRALPGFYAVKFRNLTFVLGLSGFGGQSWSASGLGFVNPGGDIEESLLGRALEYLSDNYKSSTKELARTLGLEPEQTQRLLVRLCRQGRAVFDLEERGFRHRELFESPVEEAEVFPPDRRLEEAREIIAAGKFRIDICQPKETKKIKKLKTPEGRVNREIIYRDWFVTGLAGGHEAVELVINDVGQIIFGSCDCDFFREHLMNDGPCAHMIALFEASETKRPDLNVSRPVEFEP